MLTIAAVKAARPQARAYKLGDAGGLFLFVAPGGLKSWRVKYRFGGREQLIVVGRHPGLSLADARARRDALREQLLRGENPARSARREAGAAVETRTDFESVARAWHAHQRDLWSAVHARDVIGSLERDVFPTIGALELSAIDAPAVLRCLRAIEARGRVETARRVRQRISAVFGFAIPEGLATLDPAAIVRRSLLPRPIEEQHPAIVDIDALRALLAAIDRAPATAAARGAVCLLALTSARLAAVLGMRWDEIEGIDWSTGAVDDGSWRIPPARMKLSRAKKAIARFEHVVPLSRQAVTVLVRARAISDGGPLVFPGRRPGAPIGGRTVRDLHDAAATMTGGDRHVPHGWRASFSTVMNEQYREDRAAIDLALAHAPKDKVEAAYNRAEHLDRRRVLMQAWADLILPDR